MVLRDDGAEEPDVIEANGASVVVHRSGTRLSLRVRDPNGERARNFEGFEWFPISRDYRVLGRFIADATPRDLPVVNTFGDVDTYQTEGVVEFTLNGQMLRLRPFTTEPGRFYFVFNDASSGNETYEAARFLYSDLREDGTTILDFNEAYNPPCSFNPFTTCPIPLPENRLPIKVLAGEKKYRGAEPALLERRQPEMFPNRRTDAIYVRHDQILQPLDCLLPARARLIEPDRARADQLRAVDADQVDGQMDDGEDVVLAGGAELAGKRPHSSRIRRGKPSP